jgi:hypothetical protein
VAVGTMIKLYPAIVAFAGLMRNLSAQKSVRSGWAGFVSFVLLSVAILAGWMAWCGQRGVARSVAYHAGRGLEYGSAGAGAAMLVAKIEGAEIAITREHGSFAVETGHSAFAAAALPWLQAGVTLGALALAIKNSGCVVRASAAAIVGFVLMGKVFSPQYLIWPLPFVAAVSGRGAGAARWLYLGATALTLAAQGLMSARGRTDLVVILIYNLRMAFVVMLLMALLARYDVARASGSSGNE